MNHKVESVQGLHDDAFALYNNAVRGTADYSADTLINNLNEGINTLKSCWKGKDAGVQIQNVITVYNALVNIRNVLGKLAADSSKIASNYREIQNANGAGLSALNTITSEDKTILPDYTDTADKVDITPEAEKGKAKIDAANDNIANFIREVSKYFNNIMNNWTVGTGRDEAKTAFETFNSQSTQYKETLSSVSSNITTALQNYVF
mgnify:FL=1